MRTRHVSAPRGARTRRRRRRRAHAEGSVSSSRARTYFNPDAVAVAVEPTHEEQVLVQEAAGGCRGSSEQRGSAALKPAVAAEDADSNHTPKATAPSAKRHPPPLPQSSGLTVKRPSTQAGSHQCPVNGTQAVSVPTGRSAGAASEQSGVPVKPPPFPAEVCYSRGSTRQRLSHSTSCGCRVGAQSKHARSRGRGFSPRAAATQPKSMPAVGGGGSGRAESRGRPLSPTRKPARTPAPKEKVAAAAATAALQCQKQTRRGAGPLCPSIGATSTFGNPTHWRGLLRGVVS